MSKLNKLCAYLEKVTIYLISGIGLAMMAIMWIHVFARYIFRHSLFWSEELLRYALVYLAMLGASILYKRGRHVGVTLFISKFSQKFQARTEFFLNFVFLFISSIVFYQGVELCWFVKDAPTPALRISQSIPYLAIVAGFLLMLIYSLARTVYLIHNNREGNENVKKERE